MVEKESPIPPQKEASPLARLSNEMVALHREHFGRGPAAARSFIAEGMAVCMLTDVYTRVERTLIEAGRFDHVRQTRLLHHETLAESYKSTAEVVLGRRVVSFTTAVDVEPDVIIEIFLLGAQRADDANETNGPGAGTD